MTFPAYLSLWGKIHSCCYYNSEKLEMMVLIKKSLNKLWHIQNVNYIALQMCVIHCYEKSRFLIQQV